MKIGVFDSGVGGQSFVNAIQKAFPEAEVIYADDKEHLPYGNRQREEILGFVKPILKNLVDQGCRVIVIACNTVSTNLINELREYLPQTPLIAVEPMVKPASELTKSKTIAVCATPRTLASERYKWLKDTYAQNIKVLEPDCRDWTMMIENNQIDRQKIDDRIEAACEQGADVIVLGCTHYHWIEDLIKEITRGRAEVLQPEKPVIAQLQKVITELDN